MRFSYLKLFELSLLTHGATAVITGGMKCNKWICVTGLYDNQKNVDTYTIAPPEPVKRDDFGWMAIGFGNQMSGSPMVILWPNGDGSITLSQREAPSPMPPSIVANPARVANLDSQASYSNSTGTSFTFVVPSVPGISISERNNTPLIWAWSQQNPGSASDSAAIVRHDTAGTLQMSLLAQWPTSSADPTSDHSQTSSPAPTPTDAGEPPLDEPKSNKMLIIHAVCGVLATMVFLPTGTVIPRLARGYSLNRWWFPVHGIVNGVIGGLLLLITYIIARTKFHEHGKGLYSSHRNLGLALFIMVLLQIVLGVVVHWVKVPSHPLTTTSGRGPSNFVHMVLGTVIVILGWVTTWKGMDVEWPTWSIYGQPVSSGYKILWCLVVGLTTLTYLVGLLWLLPKQLAMERQSRLRHAGISAPRRWVNDRLGGDVQDEDGLEMMMHSRLYDGDVLK